MPARFRQNRLFLVINILLITLGLTYLLLQLGSTATLGIIQSKHRAMLASPLLVLWGLTILIWVIMMTQRLRHARDRQRKSTANALPMRSTTRPTTRQPHVHDVWANSQMTTRRQHLDGNSIFGGPQTIGHSLQQNSILVLNQANSAAAIAFAFDHVTKPTSWTKELLLQLEWFQFEQVCINFFEHIELSAVSLFNGPDADVSLAIKRGQDSLDALAKCAAGNTIIDIEQIRALYAVMKQAHIVQGFFITAGQFTVQAKRAARGVGLFLIDGATMFEKIISMTPAQQETLLEIAIKGDYLTPSCPLCLKKMSLRESEFSTFWRCVDYRSCKGQIRPDRAAVPPLPSPS